jgi:perosamine synthetase|tara:strand:+ start:115 stop:1206 length:1092 start_codon:yes stop_codon:yes gene_type:complete
MKRINQIEPSITLRDKSAISKYLNSNGWITENKVSKKFEIKFSKLVKSKYSIVYPNGTLTIVSILLALGIKKNDEVIVPNYTMVATVNAVILTGAKPILCDISDENLCLDPNKLASKINKNTKAVIYVTLNGRSGFIKQIQKICKKKKLHLIEDSAHSIGSYLNKKHHGTFGIASSFSLSMPKLITTGQGGFVVTNNKTLANRVNEIKNFGRRGDGNDIYFSIGYNFKFTDLQSSLGISQLQNIQQRIKKKRQIFHYYYKNLKEINEIKMFDFQKNETPWFVDIYLKNPKKLQEYLKKFNIISRLVYPPLNSLKIFKVKGGFKNSTYYCNRGLWLPSSINLKEKDIKFIVNKINFFFNDYAQN